MKKLFIALSACLLGAMTAFGATCLQLVMADGSTPSYTLADRPVISFDGADMVIDTDQATISYNRSNITKMQFVDSEAAIEEVSKDAQNFSYLNGIVSATGSEIRIYSLSGALQAEGFNTLSTVGLPAGIYVVKTLHHTVKISIK